KVLCPYDGISTKYLYRLMQSYDLTDRGYARHFKVLNDKLVPLPPLPEQHRIVAKIDQLMARCDELEKIRAEREQKRRSVHAAALKQLLDAQAADRLADAWQFISQHFGDLYAVKENVAELRKAILQLAVMGKLVPQDPNDPPASQLLKDIEAEKSRRWRDGEIKAPKPLPEIKSAEMPYALPRGWAWMRIPDCYYGIGNKSNQIQTKDYFESGLYPVVDQGKAFIAAYSNEEEKLLSIPKPVIVFGDHTKNIKFIDFDFVIGADGVKVLCPYDGISTKYLYRLMQSYDLTDRGYARHFKVLNDKLVPLPPLPEQHRIVAKIDQLMALCDTLEQQIDAATSKQTELLDALMAPV
ncbi:MAG: restriction endonuclease subunit S, partial [Rugosibacter sp.]|nr:restriction endonuclease subunit S [Rugosibacter sp.]